MRDILVSPLGEATEFLPIKVIAPEMQADIQELLTPIFEDYHRVMVRNYDVVCTCLRVNDRDNIYTSSPKAADVNLSP